MDKLDVLMEHLKEAEGAKVHYNRGESDITAPYGIYKAYYPNAKIFKTIDLIAKILKIYKDSKNYTDNEIELINEYIYENNLEDKIYNEAKEFYSSYLRGMHLELLPEKLIVLLFSMYVNSKRGFWESIQNALIALEKEGVVKLEVKIIADGYFGKKTKKALQNITKYYNDDKFILAFKYQLLFFMQVFYVKLATKDKKRYFKFLKGWKNRLMNLV